ncbi:hypothetical protein FKV25_06560 [Lysobacter aestuarii]|uniref:DUF4175 domain-containing protein n=1 Tax=Marilutibacter aestuarii TaxID=1706195 RepID=A0A508AHJ9_9GAMM|nr:hypothetical protein FKV25_06560 [Lysobacter aestuarii]
MAERVSNKEIVIGAAKALPWLLLLFVVCAIARNRLQTLNLDWLNPFLGFLFFVGGALIIKRFLGAVLSRLQDEG